MVFYTFYKSEYIKFQNITKYPKFIGDCLQQCRFHLNPNEIFNSIEIEFDHKSKIEASAPIIREQSFKLINLNFPNLDFDKFWKYCFDNFPK
jgi:hypothetical protein